MFLFPSVTVEKQKLNNVPVIWLMDCVHLLILFHLSLACPPT